MTTTLLPFSSLLEVIIDNRGKTCPTVEQGLPLIATNCIKQEHLYPVFENVRYVSDETYQTWFRGHPLAGDLILVTKGSPGRVCWVPNPVNFCIAQDMVAIRADESKVYSKYLFAVLRSQRVQDEIEALHVGSLIPHFKKGDFDKLFISVPDRECQRFIGDLHFELCQKIDLLHQQNQTLEEIAEIMYRQWFLEEEIPMVTKIGSVIDTKSGGTPSRAKENYYGPGHRWVKSKELNRGFVFETEETITEEGLLNSSAKLLPRHSILIAMYGATVGEYAVLAEEATCNQAVCALLPNESYPFEFLFPYVKSIREDLVNNAVGSAQQNISQVLIKQQEIPASLDKIQQYSTAAKPLFEKIEENTRQIVTLQLTRNTLLPKLMSGDVRIQPQSKPRTDQNQNISNDETVHQKPPAAPAAV